MLHEFPLNLAINTPKYEMFFIAVLMNLHNIQKEMLELRYCVHEEKNPLCYVFSSGFDFFFCCVSTDVAALSVCGFTYRLGEYCSGSLLLNSKHT